MGWRRSGRCGIDLGSLADRLHLRVAQRRIRGKGRLRSVWIDRSVYLVVSKGMDRTVFESFVHSEVSYMQAEKSLMARLFVANAMEVLLGRDPR
ncbi:hypothetical protein MBHK15_100216 [Marinobacter salarius]|nr:hypothetical protein MBHK15_100216 [Marinobacter salarius]